MQFHSLIVDNALSDYARARAWADAAEFRDVANPVDGVTYPLICPDVPVWIQREMSALVNDVLNEPLWPSAIFARMSPAGVPVPHQAHNDASMGRYSLMLYLNRPEHCRGGTEFLTHSTLGCECGPSNHDDLAQIAADANKPFAWDVAGSCAMKANRACLFDASLMHRAAPIGGFGDDQANARLVLTGFYS